MKKVTMNPYNRVYYSDSYIKGWEDGVRDQYNATMSTDDNWIPVSEKLPDEDDCNEYIVIDDRGYMAVGSYRHDAKAWDSGNFGWLEIRDKTDEFPWGIGKVIAWYKPKPYKESEVEE